MSSLKQPHSPNRRSFLRKLALGVVAFVIPFRVRWTRANGGATARRSASSVVIEQDPRAVAREAGTIRRTESRRGP